jgi:hypothetical protein
MTRLLSTRLSVSLAAIALAASQPAAANVAAAGARLPVVLASTSQAFHDSCPCYADA